MSPFPGLPVAGRTSYTQGIEGTRGADHDDLPERRPPSESSLPPELLQAPRAPPTAQKAQRGRARPAAEGPGSRGVPVCWVRGQRLVQSSQPRRVDAELKGLRLCLLLSLLFSLPGPLVMDWEGHGGGCGPCRLEPDSPRPGRGLVSTSPGCRDKSEQQQSRTQSGGRKPRVRVPSRWAPPGGLSGGSAPCLFRLVDPATPPGLCLSSPGLFALCVCLCPHVSVLRVSLFCTGSGPPSSSVTSF